MTRESASCDCSMLPAHTTRRSPKVVRVTAVIGEREAEEVLLRCLGESWSLWEPPPPCLPLKVACCPLPQFCRKWCYGGKVTSYGRACPTRQPSPHSASRAQPPWVRCGPPASCLTTTAGSRPPGPRSCWASNPASPSTKHQRLGEGENSVMLN